jgi:hypothetical protein
VSDWHVLADLGYAGHLPTGIGPSNQWAAHPALVLAHLDALTRDFPAFQFTLMSTWNSVACAAVHRK